jgi:hypothetical protein
MELQQIDVNARRGDGGMIILRSYPVHSLKHAINLAETKLGKQPYCGCWIIQRANGKMAEFRDVAFAVDGRMIDEIEWK